jgi:lactate dehydrogenase-like 2-hydroxyacid dehydrogenase
MKVYCKSKTLQDYLKSQNIEGVHIVDDPKDSHYMITGQFSIKDYHDGLKGIIIPYTGHNGIHLGDMRKHHLKLYVTPTRTKYVAEKVMALTLALMGKVTYYHRLMKQGDWAERNTDQRVPWVSLQNKKIGFLGYGRIGKKVHQFLKPFDCEFYTIDRQKVYQEIHLVKDLEALIQVSDVIIVSVPLNFETENMIGEPLLKQMKDKYLINVGRGRIVNQKDLYEALKNRSLAGYASDVWYNYPKDKEQCFPSDYPIHEFDHVVMSNHSGGFTTETTHEVYQDLIKQLIKLRDCDESDALDLSKLI